MKLIKQANILFSGLLLIIVALVGLAITTRQRAPVKAPVLEVQRTKLPKLAVYEDDQVGVRFSYPAGWSVRKENNGWKLASGEKDKLTIMASTANKSWQVEVLALDPETKQAKELVSKSMEFFIPQRMDKQELRKRFGQ